MEYVHAKTYAFSFVIVLSQMTIVSLNCNMNKLQAPCKHIFDMERKHTKHFL